MADPPSGSRSVAWCPPPGAGPVVAAGPQDGLAHLAGDAFDQGLAAAVVLAAPDQGGAGELDEGVVEAGGVDLLDLLVEVGAVDGRATESLTRPQPAGLTRTRLPVHRGSFSGFTHHRRLHHLLASPSPRPGPWCSVRGAGRSTVAAFTGVVVVAGSTESSPASTTSASCPATSTTSSHTPPTVRAPPRPPPQGSRATSPPTARPRSSPGVDVVVAKAGTESRRGGDGHGDRARGGPDQVADGPLQPTENRTARPEIGR